MAAEPPLGQLDPEDQESEEEELEIGMLGETPKHFAVQVPMAWARTKGMGLARGQSWSPAESSLFQVVDMLALHLPPEKLCPLLVSDCPFCVWAVVGTKAGGQRLAQIPARVSEGFPMLP